MPDQILNYAEFTPVQVQVTGSLSGSLFHNTILFMLLQLQLLVEEIQGRTKPCNIERMPLPPARRRGRCLTQSIPTLLRRMNRETTSSMSPCNANWLP